MKAPKDIVRAFLTALNKEDFDTAGTYLAPSMKFEGVMGSRDSAEAYIADMSKMKFKYDVQKVFENGNDVCVYYEIDMDKAILPCFGWYHVSRGRIANLKVIFDPRPLLDSKKK